MLFFLWRHVVSCITRILYVLNILIQAHHAFIKRKTSYKDAPRACENLYGRMASWDIRDSCILMEGKLLCNNDAFYEIVDYLKSLNNRWNRDHVNKYWYRIVFDGHKFVSFVLRIY